MSNKSEGDLWSCRVNGSKDNRHSSSDGEYIEAYEEDEELADAIHDVYLFEKMWE